MNMFRKNTSRGFTLVELMVILSIVAILAAVSVPSFLKVVRRERFRELNRSIYTAVSLARREAQRRNKKVLVAFTTTSVKTFIDADANSIFDAGTDPLLYEYPKGDSSLSSGFTISSTFPLVGSARVLRIRQDGFSVDASDNYAQGTITTTDNFTSAEAEQAVDSTTVTVTIAGIPRIQ